jgi:hypothetical protein
MMNKSMTSRPLISMRLWKQHLEPALLNEHLALLQRQRGACDEVWFASEYGFPPLAFHQDCASRMTHAAAQVRATGIGASLQISNTLGHGDAHQSCDFRGFVWQPMMAVDGKITPYCACPRAPEFHAYLGAFTRAYCAWQPDRLWIDDDLRMHNHQPVANGCFCERCLAGFNVFTGQTWTREALGAAINEHNDLAVREAWLNFGRDSLAGVARTVARAAIAVAPDCRLGLQHCDQAWGGYNGPDWEPIFSVLQEVSGHPVGSRPGGGFYVDHRPREMLDKALFTSLQNARLPDGVEISSYECENLPGTVTGKSARGTALECTLALAHGCNSLSFTPLMFPHESAGWHERMLVELATWRPFWARYVAANKQTTNTGIELVLSPRQTLRRLHPGEPPFSWANCGFGSFPQLATLGLPLCWNGKAPAALLCAPAAWGVDAAELRVLLARGLLIDGEAVQFLEQRGLAQVLGLRSRPVGVEWGDISFTDDPLNAGYAGQRITCGGFLFGTARSFELLRGQARCLARYARFDGIAGEMETAAVEFADGGRLVVFGWGLSNPTVTAGRRRQILAAAKWAGRGHWPVTLETPSQVVVVPRVDAKDRVVTVLLLNVSLDSTPSLTLLLHQTTDAEQWTWRRPFDPDVVLAAGETLTLPPLAPWSVGVLAR